MRTVNKVIIIGNITRDATIKTTESGKKVALYTIATNRHFKTADGENRTETEFHNCVSWGMLAERCEEYLKKGKLVYAEWRLKTRIIEKENGEKIYKTEVVVTNLIFLNKKSDFEEIDDSFDDSEDDKY